MKISLKVVAISFLSAIGLAVVPNSATAQVTGAEDCDHFSYMQTADGTCVDLTYMSTSIDPLRSSGGVGASPLIRRFMAALDRLDISVQQKNCDPGVSGSYNYARNVMTLCQNNLKNNQDEYIATLAHESWHLIQDYVAGLDNATIIPVTLGSGDYEGFSDLVSSLDLSTIENILVSYDGEDHPFEVEAFFMEDYPESVVEVLEAFASF